MYLIMSLSLLCTSMECALHLALQQGITHRLINQNLELVTSHVVSGGHETMRIEPK